MRTITSVGISLILIGVATLTARKLLGTMLVDELAANDSAKPAVNAVWEIGTGLLKTMAVASVGYGVVILAGTVLAGPTRPPRGCGSSWLRACGTRCGRHSERRCCFWC